MTACFPASGHCDTAAQPAFRVYSRRTLPFPVMSTFYDRFVECAERWPGNTALQLQRHDQIESCTYAELKQMAESVGRWVSEKFEPGARLALLADNHPRWVAAYLGIIASGRVVVPLDTALHADQVTKLLKDSGTSAMFCDSRHVAVAHEAVSGLNVGLVLMDPERMTGEAAMQEQPKWIADLPAIFKAGPGTFKRA
ncbi:MAG TPA: class I adenylate-forming enzyme family protein, partial [Terriglobales bacterium]|nr:class I adenylate-forming enzyme family protein [Terriglobales bacterium]